MNVFKEKVSIVLVSLSILMFFIFPTSYNGTIYTVDEVILTWSILSLCIIAFLLSNTINRKSILTVSIMLIYMIIATAFANHNSGYEISVARIAPVLCASLLFSGEIKKGISFKYFERTLHIMCLILIVWNILTMINNKAFFDFVVRFYTQFYDSATESQLLRGKPVFTFGVHNVAAFFYMQFFLLCKAVYDHNRKQIFIFYMVALFVFTLMLKSTTSFGYSIIMLFILFFMTRRNKKIRNLFLLGMLIGAGVFIASPMFETYKTMLFSETNGFIPRYFGETTIFSNNMKILSNNVLGIGFTIPRGELGAYFADSGFLVYLTMGSIFFVFTMYYLIYMYVRNNFKEKYRYVFLLTVILFELSMPSLLYLKGIYFYLFAAYFYNSLTTQKMEENINQQNLLSVEMEKKD